MVKIFPNVFDLGLRSKETSKILPFITDTNLPWEFFSSICNPLITFLRENYVTTKGNFFFNNLPLKSSLKEPLLSENLLFWIIIKSLNFVFLIIIKK